MATYIKKRYLFSDFKKNEVAILDNATKVILLDVSLPFRKLVQITRVYERGNESEWVEIQRITKNQTL